MKVGLAQDLPRQVETNRPFTRPPTRTHNTRGHHHHSSPLAKHAMHEDAGVIEPGSRGAEVRESSDLAAIVVVRGSNTQKNLDLAP